MTKWSEPNDMHYDFYQAPHPWGPWNQIGSFSDRFLGPTFHMYGPSICARFQERRGSDVEVALFTSGCPFDDVPAGPYKMWSIPVLLRTTPLPESKLVGAGDPQIRYQGLWFPWTTATATEEIRLPRSTQSKGSAAELTFLGTGIEYIAAKSSDQGSVDIFLDGEPCGSESLKVDDFPVLLGVSVFSRQKLPNREHKMRVLNSGDWRINVEGFRIYS